MSSGLGGDVDTAIAVFGTATRVSILRHLLHEGDSHAGDIASSLGIARVTISKALESMESLGVITVDTPRDHRHGKRVLYTANRERIAQLLSSLQAIMSGN